MGLRQVAASALLIGGIGAIGASLVGIVPAYAQHAPVIVVPGRRGVPVYINGRDATGAVVYGDWGLNRPGHMAPIVIWPQPWPRAGRRYYRHHGARIPRRLHAAPGYTFYHYYPGGGIKPRFDQHDEQSSGPPKPAQSYSRSWSTDSSQVPADLNRPSPVIIAPPIVEPRVPARRKSKP